MKHKPIVQSLLTCVKDTTHALTIFEQINEAQHFHSLLLFAMDVVSLYTSISHADGLRALSFFFDHRPPEARYPSTLVQLAELVLTLNTFEFDGQIFHQISGVAMGTKMGPSYACLFMGHLEYRIMESFTSLVPELYKRYIDNGFGASSWSESVLLDFIYFVQNFHPSVKFTYNISPVSVEFLDIEVNIKDG